MSDMLMPLSQVLARDIEQVKVAAQNSANVNTSGYRAMRITQHMVQSPVGDKQNNSYASLTQGIKSVSTRDGALVATRRPTDLAISGNGWFVVQTPDGMRLTREGHFHLSESGALLNQSGYPVLGESGPIDGLAEDFTVSHTGEIASKNTTTTRLLVQQTAGVNLRPEGSGLFVAVQPAQVASDYMVVQGAIERSNVDASAEMVRLMETTRHFESVQRAMSAYEQMLNNGISEIGKE